MGKIVHVVCFRSRKPSPREESVLILIEEYSAFACACLLAMISHKQDPEDILTPTIFIRELQGWNTVTLPM